MNFPSLIILLVVAVALFFAVRSFVRAGKVGGCGSCGTSGCSGCSSGGSCPYCQSKSSR